MPEKSTCRLCETKPPRRFCPALQSDICAPCCGQEREQTVDCPLDCEYLREAREHEKLPAVDPKSIPHPEIELSDRFLQQNQPLAIVTGRLLLIASLDTPGVVDLDLRDAIEALVRTYKTAESGLIYESRPANMLAAQVVARFQEEINRFREQVAQQTGSHTVLDKDVLGVLVFWQRMELQRNNGRRKGRAFMESLFSLMPPPKAGGESPSLVQP
jgi:hypothetical protein